MRRRPAIGLRAALVGLLGAGCLPAPATTEARSVADLYLVFIVLSVVVAAVVWGIATFAIVRYRGGAERVPVQRHGDTRLEVAWTALPAVTVAILFILTMAVLGRLEGAAATAPSPGADPAAGEVRVDVHAFRWGWAFSYPDAGVSVEGFGEPGPEMVVPVGEPVAVTLTATDVVHAFYVPAFLFKRDAIPGTQTRFTFTPDREGIYAGQCAEFCGVLHARMPFTIRVVPRPAFEAWLADRLAGGDG